MDGANKKNIALVFGAIAVVGIVLVVIFAILPNVFQKDKDVLVNPEEVRMNAIDFEIGGNQAKLWNTTLGELRRSLELDDAIIDSEVNTISAQTDVYQRESDEEDTAEPASDEGDDAGEADGWNPSGHDINSTETGVKLSDLAEKPMPAMSSLTLTSSDNGKWDFEIVAVNPTEKEKPADDCIVIQLFLSYVDGGTEQQSSFSSKGVRFGTPMAEAINSLGTPTEESYTETVGLVSMLAYADDNGLTTLYFDDEEKVDGISISSAWASNDSSISDEEKSFIDKLRSSEKKDWKALPVKIGNANISLGKTTVDELVKAGIVISPDDGVRLNQMVEDNEVLTLLDEGGKFLEVVASSNGAQLPLGECVISEIDASLSTDVEGESNESNKAVLELTIGNGVKIGASCQSLIDELGRPDERNLGGCSYINSSETGKGIRLDVKYSSRGELTAPWSDKILALSLSSLDVNPK